MVLGADEDSSQHFVWDNESPRTTPVTVAKFKVARKPCSIGEFHRFVFKEQGYASQEWWDPVDFDILQKQKQLLPATWSLADAHDQGASFNPSNLLVACVSVAGCPSACWNAAVKSLRPGATLLTVTPTLQKMQRRRHLHKPAAGSVHLQV